MVATLPQFVIDYCMLSAVCCRESKHDDPVIEKDLHSCCIQRQFPHLLCQEELEGMSAGKYETL